MKLVFLGGGNMAAAMIGGLQRRAAAGAPPAELRVVECQADRRAWLARELGVAVQEAADASSAAADVLVLAVKPQDLRAACAALPRPPAGLVLSIAAGVPSSAIARWCATPCVVRAMPNTPALVGAGITGLYARPEVSAAQRAYATEIATSTGAAVWLADEEQLHAVTAVSGSGPAYVFYFLDALQEAALRMGLDAQEARRLCVRTFAGAAQLAEQSPETFAVLRERVTSKGGTTAAAIASLQAHGVGAAIAEAALAAQARSREMARDMGGD